MPPKVGCTLWYISCGVCTVCSSYLCHRRRVSRLQNILQFVALAAGCSSFVLARCGIRPHHHQQHPAVVSRPTDRCGVRPHHHQRRATCHAPTGRPATCDAPTGRPHHLSPRTTTCHARPAGVVSGRTTTSGTLQWCRQWLHTLPTNQGLTLVHFSAQPEPFLKQKLTLQTP